MIKLFEPFQPKIGRHTNTGFLQSLWDKYVPVSSKNYDRISLIYLHGMPGEDTKPKQQINLLVNFVLKNFFMQMNLSQNPMLFNQTSISGSVRHLREIYLNQLKKIDFQLYQSLKQYAVYLERSENEEIRYREWAKENEAVTKMQREYQVLQELSSRLNELTSVQSVQLERKYGKNLFRSLDKKEYKLLSEAFLWAEKKQVEEYIQHCSDEQYLRICRLLKKEPELYSALRETGRPEVMIQSSHLADASGTVTKEQLILLIRSYGQKGFRRFCHQVLFPDIEMDKECGGLLQAGILWKKNKKEIYQQFKQMTADEIHSFWEEIPLLTAKICQMQEGLQAERVCRKFSASLTKIQKKYVSEISTCIQDTVLHTENKDEFEIIKNAVDLQEVSRKDHVWVHRQSEGQEENRRETVDFLLTLVQTEGKTTNRQLLWSRIEQIHKRLSEHLKEQEQTILYRQRKALEKYEDIYIEILSEKELPLEQPDRMISLQDGEKNNIDNLEIEEIFREKYGITKLSRTWIEKLQGWSEAILASMEPGKGNDRTESPHQQTPTSKDKEDFQRLIIQLAHDLDVEKENRENSTGGRITHQGLSEARTIVYREEWLQNVYIQELLQYFRQIETEERRDLFIRQMADMIVIQSKTADRDVTQEKTANRDIIQEKTAGRDITQEKTANRESAQEKAVSKDAVQQKISDIETIRKKYEKNISSKTWIQKLENWGEALLNFTEQGREKVQAELSPQQIQALKEQDDFQQSSVLAEQGQERTQADLLRKQIQMSKDKADFQRLSVQLAHYMEKEEESAESGSDTRTIQSVQEISGKALFVYREEQLQDVSIQELLQHLRQIKREERQEFIRQLADIMILQKQTAYKNITQKQTAYRDIAQKQTVYRDITQKQIANRETLQKQSDEWNTAAEIFLKKYETYNPSKTFIQKLDRWSKELLAFTKQGQEDTRTEITRQQIQASKDRAEFQRLSTELVHYIKEEEKDGKSSIAAKVMQYAHEMSERSLIVYRDEQFQNVKIQELLQYLRQVKEGERKELIRQLAGMLLIQKYADSVNFIQEREAGTNLIQKYAAGRELIQKKASGINRLQEHMADMAGMDIIRSQPGQGRHSVRQYAEYERFYESYPELAFKIQRYEEQRKKIRRAEHERIQTIYADVIETVLQSEESIMQEEERLHLVPANSGHTGHQEIKYVFSEETLPGRRQKKEADMSKETLQVKSLQQQMDVRLREVERQLQKKRDVHSGTGDDVRAIAEKVKKQLHEELHMERLRRGLA